MRNLTRPETGHSAEHLAQLADWFDKQSQKTKGEAGAKARILDKIAGVQTIEWVARRHHVDVQLLTKWADCVKEAPRHCWVPLLAFHFGSPTPRSRQPMPERLPTGFKASIDDIIATARDFHDAISILPPTHHLRRTLLPLITAHIDAIEAVR